MAVPAPDKELDRLKRLCKQGLPGVLVLSGQAKWFRNRAVESVLAVLPDDVDLRTVDGQQVDLRGRGARGGDDAADDEAAELAAADDADAEGADAAAAPVAPGCPDLEVLRGGGLFATRGVLVVRRGERWLRRYGEALQAFLPHLAKGSSLVLEVGKLDKRTRLSKDLASAGELFEFRPLYETPFGRPDRALEGELVQWLGRASRALGVPLTAEAALLLCVQVGKEPGELYAELEQLRDRFAFDRRGDGAQPAAGKALGPDDLKGMLTVGFESTPFELADSILAGDRRKAYRSLRAMCDRGVRQKDGSAMDRGGLLPFAISWLWGQISQALDGRMLLDQGVPLRDVPGQVGVHGFTERFQEQVRSNERDRLERGLLALLACQREKRRGIQDDDVLLERFLLRWFDGAAIPSGTEFEW